MCTRWGFLTFLKSILISMSMITRVPVYIHSCKHTWKHSKSPRDKLHKNITILGYVLEKNLQEGWSNESLVILELLEKLVIFTLRDKLFNEHIVAVFKYLKIYHTEHVNIFNEPEGISKINTHSPNGDRYKFILKPQFLRIWNDKE